MSRLDERPWFKFRPDRWLGDADLQSCSPAAQGLWINLIALMHGSAEYGYLMRKGRPMAARDIARALPRWTLDAIESALSELIYEEVCSVRASDGCIYSRRMVRDHAKAQAGKAAKTKGLGGDEQQKLPLEGDLQGELEGHKNKKERENKKESTPHLPPSGEGGESDDGIDALFGGKADEAKPSKRAKAEPPSKPKTRGRRQIVTLPPEWAPRVEDREFARAELKLTLAEFTDAEAEFREWSTLNGRKIADGVQPNWNLAFRNSLRRFAATVRAQFRKETPPAYAHAAEIKAPAFETPQWWLDAEAKFAAHEFHARDWSEWRSCEPVMSDAAACAVRPRNDATYQILTARDRVRGEQVMLDRFADVTGLRVKVLAPEKQKAPAL